MDTVDAIVNGREFGIYADTDIDVWSVVVNCRVEHDDYGVGDIVRVTPRRGYIPLIDIKFVSEESPSTFNSESFKAGVFRHIHIPEVIATRFIPWRVIWAHAEAR